MAHIQTDTQTDGHGDSMTNPAQRAKLVKITPVLMLWEWSSNFALHPALCNLLNMLNVLSEPFVLNI